MIHQIRKATKIAGLGHSNALYKLGIRTGEVTPPELETLLAGLRIGLSPQQIREFTRACPATNNGM